MELLIPIFSFETSWDDWLRASEQFQDWHIKYAEDNNDGNSDYDDNDYDNGINDDDLDNDDENDENYNEDDCDNDDYVDDGDGDDDDDGNDDGNDMMIRSTVMLRSRENQETQ